MSGGFIHINNLTTLSNETEQLVEPFDFEILKVEWTSIFPVEFEGGMATHHLVLFVDGPQHCLGYLYLLVNIQLIDSLIQ